MAIDPFSPAAFRDAALRHLARYACSRASLRRVLQRRVTRLTRGTRERPGVEPAEDIPAIIEALLNALTDQGLLNDRLFAEGRVRSLADRGLATRVITGKLTLLGIDNDTTQHALAQLAIEQGREGDAPSDLAAATAYARRRRLGPWRVSEAPDDPKAQAKQRDKDLRSLASRGFSLDLARQVLNASLEDDFEFDDA